MGVTLEETVQSQWLERYGDRQAILAPVPSASVQELAPWIQEGLPRSGFYQFPASLGTIGKKGASSDQPGRRGEGPPFSGIAVLAG